MAGVGGAGRSLGKHGAADAFRLWKAKLRVDLLLIYGGSLMRRRAGKFVLAAVIERQKLRLKFSFFMCDTP